MLLSGANLAHLIRDRVNNETSDVNYLIDRILAPIRLSKAFFREKNRNLIFNFLNSKCIHNMFLFFIFILL